MKKRLFFFTTLILFAGLLSFFAATAYITHANNLRSAKNEVVELAHICAGLYTEDTDLSSFVKAGGDTRISVISPDGVLLADSLPLDFDAVDNHLYRPEIQAAALGNPEAFIRYSDTFGVDFIYYALKVDSGDSYLYIRTALPVAVINAYLSQSLPFLASLLIIIALLCFLIIRDMINRIAKPLASVEQKLRLLAGGEYMPDAASGRDEEINRITEGMNEVAQVLYKSLGALRDEKNKLDYILNTIGDGLFVVDENREIGLVNAAALAIFNAKPDIAGKHLHYLTYDRTLAAAVEDCIYRDKSALFELTISGRIFLATVKRLPDAHLIMVALSDVTESRENAKRREEFFANASHELKTPLTAIKGFNELTALNNKDETVRKYIDSITRETDRMLFLISDMLKLSALENKNTVNPVPLSLAKTVNEVREVLSAAIHEKAIRFAAAGDAVVTAEPEHVYELAKNLIENAVRYNETGGSVTVTIESDGGHTRLSVADDGIGIAPEEQARIFERFYRVEKSRSQRNGGTGLGLAIVKHICALYDWKLSLKSKPGVGTEITVLIG